MNRIAWLALAAVMSRAVFAADMPAAAEPIAVLVPVAYAVRAVVPVNVKAECHIENKVADDLAQALASDGLGGVATTSTSGRVLQATIERVIAQPGGGWSGPKTLSLTVQLLQDGQVVRTLHPSVTTKSLNPLSRTCASIDRASEKSSAQVVKWIKTLPAHANPVATAASAAD